MINILIVDDNADDIVLLEEAIESIGREIKCDSFPNGIEAIDYIEKRALSNSPLPDLVIMDINMPLMTGIEAVAAMRKNHSSNSLPVTILTSSDRNEDIDASYASGANICLRKPDDFRDLEQTLTGLIQFFGLQTEESSRLKVRSG